MRGRNVFLESLRAHGVTRIFGNPGTTESPLLDSLLDYPDIEYVMHLHEGVAVGAANVYAQATASTGVANMHVAPGLGNAIGMIYGALKNNSPMLITAGQQDTRARLRDPVLGHDLVAMAAPVTKWAVQVERADEMGPILNRAFKIANTAPCGPVFVSLPINVMEQDTDIGPTTAGDLSVQQPIAQSSLQAAVDLLNAAQRPGIVAGDDVDRCGALESLAALSEKLAAPVHVELLSGRFGFPSQHPNFRGRLGPDHAGMQQALGGYDVVLLIGGPFFEEIWHTDTSPLAADAKVIQIELDASRLGHNIPLTLGLAGDVADALHRIGNEIEISAERVSALNEVNASIGAQTQERRTALWDRSPMTPTRALAELGKAAPADAVVADESITASLDLVAAFAFGHGHTYYGGRGGGIGQGIAGALGAAVGHPDRPVICVSGDGSAMYSIQALWTAAHHQLNILFVILSNREYRVLKHNLDQYRQRFGVPSNKPYPHMNLAEPQLGFIAMAQGMGIPGQTLSHPEGIADAVMTALQTPGPYLLELEVEGLETR